MAFPSVTDRKKKEEQSRQKARQRNLKQNYVQRSLRSESIMSKGEIHAQANSMCRHGESWQEKKTTATSRNYSFQSTLPALTCRHASRSIACGVAFLSVCSQTWCFHFIYLATSTQNASRKYNEMDSSRKRNEDGCASTKKMAHPNKLI